MLRSAGSSKLYLAILLAGVLVAVALVAGYLPRKRVKEQLANSAARRIATPPLVNAARVTRAGTSDASLPGTITPITEAYVFARAAGYLKARYVDIGDRVSAGQLLAEIDAPDLDQQVTQAEAALSQAEGQLGQAEATLKQLIATRDLADITWQRYQVLTKTGAVSRQAGDIQQTASKTAEANVTAGEKNVVAAKEFVRAGKATLDRLITLQGYEKIRSPFDGIVTARNVDVGALISATGSSQGPARPSQAAPSDFPSSGEIFRVAQIGRLRVLVSLPQSEAQNIHVGQPASVSIEEFQNRPFPGQITRTSNSLDAASRTLLTEVQVDNRSFGARHVQHGSFHDQRAVPPFLVPDASLVVKPAAQAPGAGTADPAEGEAAMGGRSAALAQARKTISAAGRDQRHHAEILDGLRVGDGDQPYDVVKEGHPRANGGPG